MQRFGYTVTMALGESAGALLRLRDERLRRLVAGVPAGLLEFDRDGNLLWATPAFCDIAGVARERVLGSGWIDAIASSERDAVKRAWKTAVSRAAPAELEFRFAHHDANTHARMLIAPIAGEVGAALGFCAAVVNVTEFARSPSRLSQNGAQYRALAEAMLQLAWIAAPDGTIEYVNQPWIDYTGMDLQQTKSGAPLGVVHPDDLGTTWERWNTALATGAPYEIEYRLRRHKDGAYRWFIARATPVRSAGGKLLRWIGTATEIDAQKRSNANLRFVLDTAARFSGSREVGAICQILADAAVQRIADWCFVVLRGERGAYTVAGVAHRNPLIPPGASELWQRDPIRTDSPIDRCVRKNLPLLVPHIGADQLRLLARDERQLQLLQTLGMRSAIIVPLSGEDGAVHGAATMLSCEPGRAFSGDDLEVCRMVASRAAGALQTAKAFEEQRRRTERSSAIARASELIFESLDLSTTFDNVAAFLVNEHADFAYVLQIERETALRVVAGAHRDPAKAAVAAHLRGQRLMHRSAEEQVLRMLAAHRPVVAAYDDGAEFTAHLWAYLAADVRALDIRSTLTIPLHLHGETFGALVACRSAHSQPFSERDLPLFEDVGRRLSIAVEHVRAIERERRIAQALQHALLPSPQMMPRESGLIFDAEYRSCSNDAEVGGDWYDAVRLPDGEIMICVGDVAGHGIHAAGLMGKLRQAIAMAAMYQRDPARILDDVDFQLRARGSEAIVTAFVGFIAADRKTLRYAGAGHPPPLLRVKNALTELRAAGGMPLGLRDRSQPEQAQTIAIDDAELLVLYTDGLIEGTHDLAFGEGRLRRIAGSQAILYALSPAKVLCDACLPFEAQDDTAVLTVLFGTRTSWTFDADNARAAQDARAQFVAALHKDAAPDADFGAAELIFGELIGNVVRHSPGPIDVQLEWGGDRPILHVTDRGRGFVRDAALPRDPLSECGRGIYIVTQLANAMNVERVPGYGNHVAVELPIRRR